MFDSPALENQIVLALRRITRAIDLRSRVLLQFHGLTAPQLAVLRAVGQHASATVSSSQITPGEIARLVHLGQPTVTGILARLEQRGLIERTRGERDKRSQHITLSESGRCLLLSAPSPLQETFRQQLSQLHEWERTQILATLQRVAEMMHPRTGATEVLPDFPLTVAEPAILADAEVCLSADPPWTEVTQTLR